MNFVLVEEHCGKKSKKQKSPARPQEAPKLKADRRLIQGLGEALDETNLGYRMLKKMKGKSPVMSGLGRLGGGITEPIEVSTCRSSRAGLGHLPEKEVKEENDGSRATLLQNHHGCKAFVDTQRLRHRKRRALEEIRRAATIVKLMDEQEKLLKPKKEQAKHIDKDDGNLRSEEESHSYGISLDEEEVQSLPLESLDLAQLETQLMQSIEYLRNTHNYSMHYSCSLSDLGWSDESYIKGTSDEMTLRSPHIPKISVKQEALSILDYE